MRGTGIADDVDMFDSVTDGPSSTSRTPRATDATIHSGNRHHPFRDRRKGIMSRQHRWADGLRRGRDPKKAYGDLSSALELPRITVAQYPNSPMHRIVRDRMGRVPKTIKYRCRQHPFRLRPTVPALPCDRRSTSHPVPGRNRSDRPLPAALLGKDH